MRKSFGGSYGGGGGGGGSGEMLRSVGKAMRTRFNNFQENNNNYSPSSPTQKSSSSSTTKTMNTSKHALSSSSLTHSNNIQIVGYPIPNNEYFDKSNNGDAMDDCDDEKSEIEIKNEWECLENYYDYDPIFGVGVVPSTNEVQHALSSLQQALHPQSSSFSSNKELPFDVDKDVEDEITYASDTAQRASSKSSNSDWLEPSMQPYERKLAQTPGWERVYDAFHLLESEPSVQRMVVSLSSDKAVWDAVLNNEAVREIRDSYRNAAEYLPPSSDEKPEPPKRDSNILKWISDNMKVKLLEVLGTISQFVADMFKPLNHDKEEQGFGLTEKLMSSFLLTVVILLIVVVARGHKT